MPCASPPCTWPSTRAGFTTRPQSSTATWRARRTSRSPYRPRRRRRACRTGTSSPAPVTRPRRGARAPIHRGCEPGRSPPSPTRPGRSPDQGRLAPRAHPSDHSRSASSTSSRWAASARALRSPPRSVRAPTNPGLQGASPPCPHHVSRDRCRNGRRGWTPSARRVRPRWLGEGGLVTLAVRRGAGDDRDPAVAVHLDRAEFLARTT